MPEAVRDISSFTSVFRAKLTGENRRVTKRNRQPIACGTCRAKKSKCDHQKPCSACIKRGDGLPCEYGTKSTLPIAKGKELAKSEAQARLQRLEDMVSDLIVAGGASSGVQTTTARNGAGKEGLRSIGNSSRGEDLTAGSKMTTNQPPSRYFLSTEDAEASFVGATHWTAVLSDLRDIRGALGQDIDVHYEPRQTQPVAHDMYFGPLEPISLEQVLAALPSRQVIDNILSVYFSNKFFLTPFIHAPTFTRYYNSFWDNPSSASFAWLSVLFSSLCIGTTIAIRCGRSTSRGLTDISPKHFQTKAGQCIISSNYMRAQPYGIEALLLYTHSKFMQCVDPDPALWAIVSLVVRLAQKQGMHRQPEKLQAKISPFEAEMRRRLWFYIEVFDLMLSFQLGMPPIIHDAESDIGPPRNLYDSDISEYSLTSPPERPFSEKTPMLFYAVKARMIRFYRQVMRNALAIDPPAYSVTLAIDRSLHEIYAQTPEHYKIRPIRQTPFTDGIDDIMHRLLLEMIFLKNLCVLHRTYLSQGKTNPAYQQSREKCTSAALRILELQAEFHFESRPGGRLHEDKWILTSLTMHDFLIAAMCIGVAVLESEELGQTAKMRLLGPLTISYNIWSEKKGYSRDALHACKVIGSILAKVNGKDSVGTIPQDVSGAQTAPSSVPDLSNGASAAPTILSSSGLTPPMRMNGTAGLSADMGPLVMDDAFDDMDLDSLNNLLGDMDNLNWATIDNYILDVGNDHDSGLDFAATTQTAEQAQVPKADWLS